VAGVHGNRTHPTRQSQVANGFEDRESHQAPSTPNYCSSLRRSGTFARNSAYRIPLLFLAAALRHLRSELRKHETAGPARDDLTDLHTLGDARKILGYAMLADRDQHAAGRLRVNEQRAIDLGGAPPVDA
jgi:hypothetical protein